MNPFIKAANILFSSSSVSALQQKIYMANFSIFLALLSVKVQMTHSILYNVMFIESIFHTKSTKLIILVIKQ